MKGEHRKLVIISYQIEKRASNILISGHYIEKKKSARALRSHILMLCFQATIFEQFPLALRARITFFKRVILIGFCTKKALKMSLLGYFIYGQKRTMRASRSHDYGLIIIQGEKKKVF